MNEKFDEARIVAALERLFADDHSGHDLAHTLRVYRNALKIAESEACDERIVALAALLHDADDPKLFDTRDHANARVIMADAGVDAATAEAVVEAIRTVSFGSGAAPTTIEGAIVQDADRLDAIGAIGIGRAFAYGGAHGRAMHDPSEPPRLDMDEAAYRASKSTTINHFYEKLLRLKDLMNTKTARRLAEHRTRVLRDFLDEFLAEWDGRK